jgi:oxaloacetate decarboxylase alpha subunit
VEVGGQAYVVKVSPGGDIDNVVPVTPAAQPAGPAAGAIGVVAPLSGNIFKINVKIGDHINSGDVVLVLEAMKMETEIRASSAGRIAQVLIQEGQSVSVGDTLITFG